MIKLTYKRKNRNQTIEKQALPSVQPETETLVEAVLSASQVSLAAGASAPSGERADRHPPGIHSVAHEQQTLPLCCRIHRILNVWLIHERRNWRRDKGI